MNRPKEYRTRRKDEILEFLNNNGSQHVTAADIISHLRESGSTVGSATVYRNLEKLSADGYIRKYFVGENSPACYQLSSSACSGHHHLRCLECGKLIHLSCGLLDEIGEHVKAEHGFSLDKTKTVLYGYCSDCNPNE